MPHGMPTEHATRVEVKDAHCHIAVAPLPHESARNRRLLGWPLHFGVAKSKLIKPDSKHTITELSTQCTVHRAGIQLAAGLDFVPYFHNWGIYPPSPYCLLMWPIKVLLHRKWHIKRCSFSGNQAQEEQGKEVQGRGTGDCCVFHNWLINSFSVSFAIFASYRMESICTELVTIF